MKKFFLLLFITTMFYLPSIAAHIAGGEIFYKYMGPGAAANTDRYQISLRLFRECTPPLGGQMTADMPTQVWIGLFNNTSPSTQYGTTHVVERTSFDVLLLSSPGSCINNPPSVCYQVGVFTFTTDLPVTSNGYVASFQTCCRTNGISNVNGNAIGATYVAEIPGTTILSQGKNTSAVFSLKDTTLICQNSPFVLDFSATDADGDSLSYAFCAAYNGGPTVNSTNVTPSRPPYGNINYSGSFSGNSPLGSLVNINPISGVISGTSPNAGSYVVNVCVSEFRNRELISVHRKDFTLKIAPCTLSGAELKPSYITCDGFNLLFSNESTSSNISSYAWDFGDPLSGANNVSNQPTPTHIYTDTGVYVLKLKVESPGGCRDSATAQVRVFPGFAANFDVAGSCFQTPFQFNDRSTAAYGNISTWRWNFGDLASTNDTSIIKNPTYKYPTAGTRSVEMIVTSTKGCIDTITKQIVANDIPLLNLPFKDTLICSIDTLQLHAAGSGSFAWTPNYNIINPSTADPFVYPKNTTRYIVTLNESGCVKSDTVTVNVLDFITVDAGRDTSLCRTDTFQLFANSKALSFSWTPSTYLNNPNLKAPVTRPDTSITYYVTANLGKCQDKDTINLKVTPYPKANAGRDTSICFQTSGQLNGIIVGSSFNWSPTSTLQNPNTLNPLAGPIRTTNYVLTAYDTLGCPKPFRDTVVVTVIPKVPAFAGRDTIIVVNQPLQLHATGGINYFWTPATGMSEPNVPNPVVKLGHNIDTIRYIVRVSTAEGCFATDDIVVRVFKTAPDLFIPSGFTPNSDGKNDVLRPTVVGMKSLAYFRVYNRWGQMMYSTSEIGKGWDGTFGGKKQTSGSYVYVAEATDYLDNKIVKKGTAVLIR